VFGNGEHILVVDDEQMIIDMLSEMLIMLGYRVTTSVDSFEALEIFRNSPEQFDLIVTDMTMPTMTGLALSKKAREIKSDIPVIICTGFSSELNSEKCWKNNIQGFLMKPVKLVEFSHVVKMSLEIQSL
jgi:CheY-like chemotaxis protein